MFYEFSLPSKADEVPTGPDSLHEAKYEYRMMIRKQDHTYLALEPRTTGENALSLMPIGFFAGSNSAGPANMITLRC
jgi:hypothetical protein